MSDDLDELVTAIMRRGHTLAVAESLTSGKLASTLGAAGDASVWFRGGVVAYASGVKFDVLRVTPGPVITEQCAREMAVFAAIARHDGTTMCGWNFSGEATEVLDATIEAVVRFARDEIVGADSHPEG